MPARILIFAIFTCVLFFSSRAEALAQESSSNLQQTTRYITENINKFGDEVDAENATYRYRVVSFDQCKLVLNEKFERHGTTGQAESRTIEHEFTIRLSDLDRPEVDAVVHLASANKGKTIYDKYRFYSPNGKVETEGSTLTDIVYIFLDNEEEVGPQLNKAFATAIKLCGGGKEERKP